MGYLIPWLRYIKIRIPEELFGVIAFVSNICGLLIIICFFTSMRFIDSFTSICIGLLAGIFINLAIDGF